MNGNEVDWKELVVLDYRCPVCKAPVGVRCTGRPQAVERGHMPRQDRYIRADLKGKKMSDHPKITFTIEDRLDSIAMIRAWANHNPDALGAINSTASPNAHLALVDTAVVFAQALAEVNGDTLDAFLDRGITAFTNTNKES